MPLEELIEKIRPNETTNSQKEELLLQYTMRARRNDMSLEEKHFVGTLISDRSGYCRHDYVAPNANFIYRCPIPHCPNPRGRGGFPINSNGLYRKFKAHLEQHHKNLPKGVAITTISREGNSRVYTYPRPSAHPPRKRYGLAEAPTNFKPTMEKSAPLPAYPNTESPKPADATSPEDVISSQTNKDHATLTTTPEAHDTADKLKASYDAAPISAPCPDEEQISLALSDTTSIGENIIKGKSSNKGRNTNSPLPLRLQDFDSPQPAPNVSDIQQRLAPPQPKPSTGPQFPPPKPPRMKKGILHDVQLDPFEYMESMARREVRLTQPDSPEEQPHPLLPDYSSQTMQYTQHVPDPEMRALLPRYSTQDSDEIFPGTRNEDTPDAESPIGPSQGRETPQTRPNAYQEPGETGEGEQNAKRGDRKSNPPEPIPTGTTNEEAPKEGLPVPTSWSPPTTQTTLLPDGDPSQNAGPPPNYDTDTLDLHEFFLAAPLTHTDHRIEYGTTASQPTDPKTMDQGAPERTRRKERTGRTPSERKNAKTPGALNPPT